jgi:hypothetical protein
MVERISGAEHEPGKLQNNGGSNKELNIDAINRAFERSMGRGFNIDARIEDGGTSRVSTNWREGAKLVGNFVYTLGPDGEIIGERFEFVSESEPQQPEK